MPATVLIADDSLFMRTLLRRVLAPLPVTVVGEAETGDEAIRGYESLKPDLLLLDITLPGTNGIAAATQILATHPEACIIVCSALATTDRAQATRQIGVRDVINKPFDNDDVRARIQKVLQERDR